MSRLQRKKEILEKIEKRKAEARNKVFEYQNPYDEERIKVVEEYKKRLIDIMYGSTGNFGAFNSYNAKVPDTPSNSSSDPWGEVKNDPVSNTIPEVPKEGSVTSNKPYYVSNKDYYNSIYDHDPSYYRSETYTSAPMSTYGGTGFIKIDLSNDSQSNQPIEKKPIGMKRNNRRSFADEAEEEKGDFMYAIEKMKRDSEDERTEGVSHKPKPYQTFKAMNHGEKDLPDLEDGDEDDDAEFEEEQ